MLSKKLTSQENTTPPIYTIGHSTHSIEDFVKLLKMHQINLVIDVRSFPVSSFAPQFNGYVLKKELAKYNIKYLNLGS
ncbi:MAG: DUF488 family protein, partial [candidate division WOR-3 bacterium]